MINVLFFAQLKEMLGRSSIQLEMNTPCDVQDIKQALITQQPQWQEHLDKDTIMCAINQTMVDHTHCVNDGDEVAFFPPVTGG